MTILAGTGHRPEKLGGYTAKAYERIFDVAVWALETTKPETVISGMAMGWDQALAEAAYALDIPFWAFVPFKGQEDMWHAETQQLFRKLLGVADKVIHCANPGYASWKMQRRNEMMVDQADAVLALWDGSSGGTGNCVAYAELNNVPIINCWSKFNGQPVPRSSKPYSQFDEEPPQIKKTRERIGGTSRGQADSCKRITRSKR